MTEGAISYTEAQNMLWDEREILIETYNEYVAKVKAEANKK